MTTYIIGLICALILAIIVITWITYCMFCKERHKSESRQYNISDLRRRNYEVAQEQMEESNTKEVTAGFIMFPTRHKDDHSYDKRPDYPEGIVTNTQPKTDKLIEIINDSPNDAERRCVGFDLDSSIPYHSDV